LYSLPQDVWKIADFGLTSEATTNRAITTHSSRGTGGYRAPELLGEDANFTNKVDIWALGCILHEIAARHRTFSSDYNTAEFARSGSTLTVDAELSPTILRAHINECLKEMLDADPVKRPSISRLCPIFKSYCILSATPAVNLDDRIPAYAQWQRTVPDDPQDISTLEPYLIPRYITPEMRRLAAVASANGALQVLIKLLTGRYLPCPVNPSTTVSEVREYVHQREWDPYPLETCVLLFKGIRLEDGWTLGDYGIRNCDRLDMVLPYWADWSNHISRYKVKTAGPNPGWVMELDS
jgi:serine/threonine protein kinase